MRTVQRYGQGSGQRTLYATSLVVERYRCKEEARSAIVQMNRKAKRKDNLRSSESAALALQRKAAITNKNHKFLPALTCWDGREPNTSYSSPPFLHFSLVRCD